MPRLELTGSRIREKRLEIGLKQGVLAKKVGISPAYLNLIEHNKRRIGGKLLLDLAQELRVDSAALAEGVESTLIVTIMDAASQEGSGEVLRANEFAGRFPGWAAVLAAQHDRIARLEHTVATLTDRMTHDPFLSTSLHEVLSTAASIRSTASILAGGDLVEPEWQARFQRNLLEDAKRLADGAGALVSHLDGAAEHEAVLGTPVEALEGFMAARDFHLPEIETGGDIATDDVSGGGVVADYIARYRADATDMPMDAFMQAFQRGADPLQLASDFNVGFAAVLRRIASLPVPGNVDDNSQTAVPNGLVVCDGSGAVTFRKPIDGFTVPRFGAGCPLWPLYQALLRPHVPIRKLVEQVGRDAPQFWVYAVAEIREPAGYDGVQVVEATMLIIPENRTGLAEVAAQPIGSNCRICSRQGCAARREESILSLEAV